MREFFSGKVALFHMSTERMNAVSTLDSRTGGKEPKRGPIPHREDIRLYRAKKLVVEVSFVPARGPCT